MIATGSSSSSSSRARAPSCSMPVRAARKTMAISHRKTGARAATRSTGCPAHEISISASSSLVQATPALNWSLSGK